ncbi:vomeronasal type-1 receptor 4-like [Orycteropus afer afer]|uniref:Vomeronasal type-1 receptor n=1 Tax=Orycteropus afer afer TaxID=1230840 RepID=A0A8B7B9G3_ORYAF|nr:vomeronasal type-1 receptor 4-like [Orycteropus afer afer]
MSSRDFTLAMIFLSQTVVGILGNFYLLYHYTFFYFTGRRLKSTDLILRHLVTANSLVILSKGIPQTIAAFGWKDFLDDSGCKLLFYVHRVARGVSIGSTCLLSVFQAVTIGPRSSRWAELKLKAPKYIGFSIVLCWVLYMLVNIMFLRNMTSNRRNKNITVGRVYGYCSSVLHDEITSSLNAALLVFPDVVCLGLMMWASSSMILILYRHKQRVQHIHRNNFSYRSSPETRATVTILLLMSTFVSFYTLSCIFQSFLAVLDDPGWMLVNIAALITGGFPTVSPFLLMTQDSSAFMLCCAWIRKTRCPALVRTM